MKNLSVDYIRVCKYIMSCHKAIMMIAGRAHCFMIWCYAQLASVRFEPSVCCGSLMTTYGYIWFLHSFLIL